MFEIANEAGVDMKRVMRELERLGSNVKEPTKRLDPDLAMRLRSALGLPSTAPENMPQSPAERPKDPRRPVAPPASKIKQEPFRSQRTIRPAPKRILGPEHNEAVRLMIPSLYEQLILGGNEPATDGVVVLYHDANQRPEYGLCTSGKERWMPAEGSGVTRDALLGPLRALDRRYRDRALMPPNMFIAIDVPNRRAWFGRSFHKRSSGPYLDASTLELIHEVSEGSPARLALRAQVFGPTHVPGLVRALGAPQDRPEEAFLLHEELLKLAVDSLDGDEQLDPLPVHLNGLWVFARPVIMRRPDGSERYVRAVWYRQGEVVWRMRTFVAGQGHEPKEVGERLFGRLPFVPVWDETRPEQKLLAAVWALMAQGGITESHPRAVRDGFSPEIPEGGDLTIVRIKAGTDHAQVYRRDDSSQSIDRPAWSVRGHWRHQPYPSLGYDAEGHVITKMKWIASYTKGDLQLSAPHDKVIVVRR